MPEYFNPHSRKGSDLFLTDWLTVTIYFNPHSRKGSDMWIFLLIISQSYFNPHSRKGSDLCPPKGHTLFMISIHTPARGVTGYHSIY